VPLVCLPVQRNQNAEPLCQRIPGDGIDRAPSDLLLEMVNPVTLHVALTVQQELQAHPDESDRLRKQQVERARYEAELAQRRSVRVDRIIGSSLTHSNEQRREQDRQRFNDEQRAEIMALAQDFPRLWRDPNTEHRDRKRMIRLLVEDVTMLRGEHITLHIRFRGGVHKTVTLPNPLRAWESWMTDAEVVGRIDQLLNTKTFCLKIATICPSENRLSFIQHNSPASDFAEDSLSSCSYWVAAHQRCHLAPCS
jgi:hypothetical protein